MCLEYVSGSFCHHDSEACSWLLSHHALFWVALCSWVQPCYGCTPFLFKFRLYVIDFEIFIWRNSSALLPWHFQAQVPFAFALRWFAVIHELPAHFYPYGMVRNEALGSDIYEASVGVKCLLHNQLSRLSQAGRKVFELNTMNEMNELLQKPSLCFT